MKMRWMVGAVSLMVSSAWAADNAAPVLTTDEDKVSYSIGADLGKHLKQQGIAINPVFFSKGIEDALKGGPLLLSDEAMKDVLSAFQKQMMAKRAEEMNAQAKTNQDAGDAFLKANQAKSGVKTLPSGLQYKIITAGTGAKPGKEDTVTVDYTGHLINGTVFDSTEKTGKPATFKVSQVIPGWTEALQLMPVGSTWELYIPAKLAYGARSVGGLIGPNETLIFNVHLISSKK
jgi:FKBP-type peptidyl-prolyl cis-trans isomerase FklB